MPAYNFKKQFADDVESGVKLHTIRPKRKRPTKPDERWYGLDEQGVAFLVGDLTFGLIDGIISSKH